MVLMREFGEKFEIVEIDTLWIGWEWCKIINDGRLKKKLGVMKNNIASHSWNKGGWTWNVIKLV
jgi:hypothetical protein